jgi:hypothetical protein
MIYEMRTYDIKPRSLPEVEKRFGEAYEQRKKYSELAGVLAHRDRPAQPDHPRLGLQGPRRAQQDPRSRSEGQSVAAEDRRVHPVAEVGDHDSVLVHEGIPEGKQGPFFEIRTYHFAAGSSRSSRRTGSPRSACASSSAPSPAVWSCELGKVNTFQHIWPYSSLNQREEIRKKAQATGLWPAGKKAIKEGGRDYELIQQENKIVMPSSFSPLQ